MQHDTAGDPITGVKWSRRTTRNIAEQLTTLGIAVSKNTVGRLLKKMDFKLRVNRKQIASTKNPDRNQQFLYIGEQRERFANQGLPIISVDAKKKEQVATSKTPAPEWDREPVLVRDHDFRLGCRRRRPTAFTTASQPGRCVRGHQPRLRQPLPSTRSLSGG